MSSGYFIATVSPSHVENYTAVTDANPLPVKLPSGVSVSQWASGLTLIPGVSTGWQVYRNINLGATGVLVKSGQGQVGGWVVCNNAAAARFLKLYNKAGVAPTVGTDTPWMTIELPANSTGQFLVPQGILFPAGIGVGATNLVADSDMTAPSANDVILNLFYN